MTSPLLSRSQMYAVDALAAAGTYLTEIETKLQTNLFNVSQWCENNNMTLNSIKTICTVL